MESTISLAAFVIGMTQLVKDTGLVKGNWLRVVAIAFGGLASYLFQYHPQLWLGMSEVIIAASATGLVSFGHEIKKK